MDITNLKQVGVIVIGIILLAIVLAFIFSGKFRKDVIASEGEAAVLGLINVKGVIIVLLTAIFGGIFVYLIRLDATRSEVITVSPIDIEKATELLSESKKDHYTLKYVGDSIAIHLNGEKIGATVAMRNRLSARKSQSEDPIWEVLDQTQRNLGYMELDYHYAYLNLENKQGHVNIGENMQKTAADQRVKKALYVNQPYQLDNSTLAFRIDSIHTKNEYYYWVSFGEGDVDYPNGIKWKNGSLRFERSMDGVLNRAGQYKCLFDANWKKLYYVGIGLGYPRHNEQDVYTHVERATVFVIESFLD